MIEIKQGTNAGEIKAALVEWGTCGMAAKATAWAVLYR